MADDEDQDRVLELKLDQYTVVELICNLKNTLLYYEHRLAHADVSLQQQYQHQIECKLIVAGDLLNQSADYLAEHEEWIYLTSLCERLAP